jgi:small ubiquitin-related modifier
MAAFDASRLSIHNSSSNAQDQQQQNQQQQQSKRPCNNSAAAQQSPGSAAMLTIELRNILGDWVLFKVRGSTKFWRVFAAYKQRMLAAHPGVEPNDYIFIFEGRRLSSDETPSDVGMEDRDIIDVMLEQLGD